MKLSDFAVTSAELVGRAGRIDKTDEIQTAILYQVRAEKNLIIASSDEEIAKFAAEIKKYRGNALRLRDEVVAATTEQGKAMLAKFSTDYEKVNAIEDDIIKFGALNSANRAAKFWINEGGPAAKGFNDALDAAVASVNRAPASIETGRALYALQTIRLEGVRSLRVMYQAIAASSEDQLAGFLKDLSHITDTLSNAVQQAAPQVSALGLSTDEVAKQTDRVQKVLARTAEIARDGGSIKAAKLSESDGRAAVGEALKDLDGFMDYIRKVMADTVAQSGRDASQAELILVAAVFVSLLVAIGSAVWISLNISRRLRRAVGLAEAVAIGDMSQTINATADDEIGDFVKALNNMTESLRATAQAAETIGSGDISVEIKRRSDKDALGIALEKMCYSLRRAAEIAGAIASGDLSIEVHRRSEKDAMGSAFETMVHNLKATAKIADAIASGDLTVEAEASFRQGYAGHRARKDAG